MKSWLRHVRGWDRGQSGNVDECVVEVMETFCGGVVDGGEVEEEGKNRST